MWKRIRSYIRRSYKKIKMDTETKEELRYLTKAIMKNEECDRCKSRELFNNGGYDITLTFTCSQCGSMKKVTLSSKTSRPKH